MALTPPLGATYGWRARIGFVTPSPGHENNGYEFYLMAPDGVTIVMTSLHVTELTQQQYDDAVGRMDVAVGELEDRRVDSIIQAGVPLVVTRGWGFEDKLLAEVAGRTHIPFATDIGACIRAMETLGMKRVVMLTPFDESMDRQLAEYVGHAGIEVVANRSLWPSDEAAMSRRYGVSTMPLAEIYRAAKDLFLSNPAADGIWITGALMPSVAIIDSLERDLGVPVVTSMQAMMWAGLGLAHVFSDVEGYGQLFDFTYGADPDDDDVWEPEE